MKSASMGHYAIAIACVVAIAAGQVLFKLTAEAVRTAGTPFATLPATYGLLAGVIYGGATLAWIWILQYLPLGRVYPLMALSFALVPLAGHLIFGEELGIRQFAGSAAIAVGIYLMVAQ